MDGSLITQHNPANAQVWKAMLPIDRTYGNAINFHQLLHDASGGRGKTPDAWNTPVAGFLNGYAGGISPDTVIDTLRSLETVVGQGLTWIDMEASLRDDADRFDLDQIQDMLRAIEVASANHGWM